MRVEIFESSKRPKPAQPWFVRLVSDNNLGLSRSEGYFSKWNAKRAAKKMFPDVPITYPDE